MSVWSEAAESNDCAVRREIIDGAGYVYALYAPNSLLSPRRVELRMRALLEEAGYAFTMGASPGGTRRRLRRGAEAPAEESMTAALIRGHQAPVVRQARDRRAPASAHAGTVRASGAISPPRPSAPWHRTLGT